MNKRLIIAAAAIFAVIGLASDLLHVNSGETGKKNMAISKEVVLDEAMSNAAMSNAAISNAAISNAAMPNAAISNVAAVNNKVVVPTEISKASERKKQIQPAENQSKVLVSKAYITRIVDGDTVVISIGGREEKVRMTGINTPETHHPAKPVEFYGQEAEAYTKSRLSGKTVYLEKDVGERDQYGRLLAYVWLSEPFSGSEKEVREKLFNARLLIDGYAQVMTIQPNVKYSELFLKLQSEARLAERGLWQGDDGVSQPKNYAGRGPNGETIKGNLSSSGEKIYHVPGGAFYDKTNPEEWFFTEDEARRSGYRKSKR